MGVLLATILISTIKHLLLYIAFLPCFFYFDFSLPIQILTQATAQKK
jgi:hypothetical protein